jgi:hypothetical protein
MNASRCDRTPEKNNVSDDEKKLATRDIKLVVHEVYLLADILNVSTAKILKPWGLNAQCRKYF